MPTKIASIDSFDLSTLFTCNIPDQTNNYHVKLLYLQKKKLIVKNTVVSICYNFQFDLEDMLQKHYNAIKLEN